MVRVRTGGGSGVLPSDTAVADVGAPTGPAVTTSTAASPAGGASTTAADRARLSGAAGGGSSVTGLRRGVDPALLAPFRAPIKKAIEALLLASPSPALSAAIEAIAAHPQAQQIVVMALTGARASRVDEAAVARFAAPAVPREQSVAALIQWHRRDAITAALAGHHEAIVRVLTPLLEAEPDPARLRRALATLTSFAENGNGTYRLAGLLRGAGCFTAEGDWRAQPLTAGSDAIGALATRDFADKQVYDDPTRAAQVEVTMAPLFASKKWTSTPDLSNHRGALGEALRIAQVQATLKSPAEQVIQGILVLDAPPGLWNAGTVEAARAYAAANGIEISHLHRSVDEAGVSRWSRRLTEIDVSVFETLPDGRMRPLRFDNVKAGVGSASKAREQNAIARDGWTDLDVRYLLPDDAVVGHYREPALDRSAAAQAGIVTASVGPSDDPRYQAALPLSSNDITALALHHP